MYSIHVLYENYVVAVDCAFLVFKLDESYTPSKVSIRDDDGFHNLKVNFYFIGLGLIEMIMVNYLVLTLGTFLGD